MKGAMCYGRFKFKLKKIKAGGIKMVSVIAKLPMKEDKVQEAITAIKELMVEVAKEEGTVLYTLNRDPKNPNTLVFMERYKDKAAVDAHSATPHFKAFFAKGAAFLAGRPEIVIMEEILSAK
jgi:quinol monooxygenase YgiN